MLVWKSLQLWTWKPCTDRHAYCMQNADALESNFALFWLISAAYMHILVKFCPFLLVSVSYRNITLKPHGALWRKIHSEVLKSNLFQIFRYHLRYCLWTFPVWKVSVSPSTGVFQYWKTIWMKDALTLLVSGGNYIPFWSAAWDFNL